MGKGTGLGLSICCQLAERMGGKLSLKSTLGKGSTFTVVFPNVRYSTKEKPKTCETTGRILIQARQNASAPANVPRILIVYGFRYSFTPVLRVLFTFPSRYWSTIGLSGVFSLGGWYRQIQTGFPWSRPTQDTAT